METLNVAGYRFVSLKNLEDLRLKLLERAKTAGLAGTILLAEEGINAFFAGPEPEVRAYIQFMREFSEFAELQFKESWSPTNPFRRMVVRVKPEIVTMRTPGVDPEKRPAPTISPAELKKKLDADEDVVLLDVRKSFEHRMGTFKEAVDLKLDHFNWFPERMKDFPEDWKDKEIVTFCTGGIRCEKAAPFMQEHGFKKVRQLEGGILNYFEQCGGEHFEGDCFVFDHRVKLNTQLEMVEEIKCRMCRKPFERNPEEILRDGFGLQQLCDDCFKEFRHKKETQNRAQA